MVLPALPASAATFKVEFSGLASGSDGSNLFGGGDFENASFVAIFIYDTDHPKRERSGDWETGEGDTVPTVTDQIDSRVETGSYDDLPLFFSVRVAVNGISVDVPVGRYFAEDLVNYESIWGRALTYSLNYGAGA